MRLLVPGVSALLALACATQSGTVRERAMYDLGFPAAQIQVQDVGGGAHRAWGCGRGAQYVCISESAASVICTLERLVTPQQQAAPVQLGPQTGLAPSLRLQPSLLSGLRVPGGDLRAAV